MIHTHFITCRRRVLSDSRLLAAVLSTSHARDLVHITTTTRHTLFLY